MWGVAIGQRQDRIGITQTQRNDMRVTANQLAEEFLSARAAMDDAKDRMKTVKFQLGKRLIEEKPDAVAAALQPRQLIKLVRTSKGIKRATN
jgi:hypothetical protein